MVRQCFAACIEHRETIWPDTVGLGLALDLELVRRESWGGWGVWVCSGYRNGLVSRSDSLCAESKELLTLLCRAVAIPASPMPLVRCFSAILLVHSRCGRPSSSSCPFVHSKCGVGGWGSLAVVGEEYDICAPKAQRKLWNEETRDLRVGCVCCRRVSPFVFGSAVRHGTAWAAVIARIGNFGLLCSPVSRRIGVVAASQSYVVQWVVVRGEKSQRARYIAGTGTGRKMQV